MRKNREYKKGAFFRDARLFLIACEGEKREKLYFERLGHGSQRLKVQVLAPNPTESLSAPNWLVDRLVKYIEKEGINVKTGDIIWIVMDVDRWKKEQLFSLAKTCADEEWGFALSNPCFEVWLLMHVFNVQDSSSTTCKGFKNELNRTVKGGYNVDSFIQLVPNAIYQAELIADDFKKPIPDFKVSRVHLPVKEIIGLF